MTLQQSISRHKGATLALAFFAAACVVCFLTYTLGLPGGLIFDDIPTLRALSAYGGIRDLLTLQLYLTEADSGPTGRPLSMLSFLIDVREWPADPGAIKFKNLLIHILNSVLLAWALVMLLRQSRLAGSEARAVWIAVLASAWWALHPLQVSTVLYAVQRMTQLSTLFVLAGLIGYLLGRARLQSNPTRSHIIMGASLITGTVLASLSKENGALLPLLVLVLEFLLLSRAAPRPAPYFRALFLWLPSGLVLVYLLSIPFMTHQSLWTLRGFGPWERLLTEFRILFDYLHYLVLPRPYTEGTFPDSIEISRSLVSPATTLPALLGTVALIGGAVALRTRLPLLATAIIFFYAGHLVESTIVPLEPYFEHRNYLPSVMLFVPLAQLLTWLYHTHRLPAIAASVLITCMLAVFTATRAELWSDPLALSMQWAERNPKSPRAQLGAADLLNQAGQSALAARLLEQAATQNPDSMAIALHHLRIKGHVDTGKDGRERLRNLVIADRYSNESLVALRLLTNDFLEGKLPGVPRALLLELWKAVTTNPHYGSIGMIRSVAGHESGRLLLSAGDLDAALDQFSLSLGLSGSVSTGLAQSAVLATGGYYCEALAHLEQTKRLLDTDRRVRGSISYYRKEHDRLTRVIKQNAGDARLDCSSGRLMTR